ANIEPLGREDVRLDAVLVLDQRDARGAVRIVLDADHDRGHARLGALEVDLAIALLVTGRAEARGDATVVVTADLLHVVLGEALLGIALGDLAEVLRGHSTATRRRWLVKTNGHG